MSEILILNGPNLNRLGNREPGIYGSASYDDLVQFVQDAGEAVGRTVEVRQTNDEGEMIDWLHEAADLETPVVLNPGAWGHYSYALRDACAMLTAPLVEVHISNIHAREAFRHHSVISPVARGVIAGLGVEGYADAIQAIVRFTA
ncbi:type II 3-dehydroquinate dehydratase [Epidermidibacterium keratini]|uniref:3-dehydroquinate dehydratase n=1 Tax=Epidermidibacterium keratini TaxID=1891644 RepID=A0A7L4YIM0_9ACTN|nr:type II 3-dehydroquinate dehydratase [Epidermidibacterium keratini]QHB99041.1 type II 3-dehydroquinate dehydratase [Epidermidibacterium keratini]